jgi:hypothetical protein
VQRKTHIGRAVEGLYIEREKLISIDPDGFQVEVGLYHGIAWSPEMI